MAALWSESASHGDPRILWTVDDNGWIYEMRITVPGRAQYHGYPILPNDAFARKIISRFIDWASSLSETEIENDPLARRAMSEVQEKYR